MHHFRRNIKVKSELEGKTTEAVAPKEDDGPADVEKFDPMADAYYSSQNQYQAWTFGVFGSFSFLPRIFSIFFQRRKQWLDHLSSRTATARTCHPSTAKRSSTKRRRSARTTERRASASGGKPARCSTSSRARTLARGPSTR